MKNCNQCGKCCINYSDGGLSVTDGEIERWRQQRPDIYAYVKNGLIWFDPTTNMRLTRCPWLKENQYIDILAKNTTRQRKFSCSIYEDRPADCRYYPVTIGQMKADECEMLEEHDLKRPKAAQRRLDNMMESSRHWAEEFFED